MDKEKDTEDDFEIEIVDDEEEKEVEEVAEEGDEDQEAETAEASEETEDAEGDSAAEEKSQYGKRAQKRIRNLVQKRKELENALSQERERANRLEAEARTQSGKLSETQDFAIKEYENRLNAESEALETQWNEAYEADDRKALFEVNKRLSQVEAARLQLEDHKRKNVKPAAGKKADESDDDSGKPAKSGDTATNSQQRVDPKALRWAAKNKWFGKDDELTMDAIDIHKELVLSEGVDPASDEYYNELDKRLYDLHPKLRKRGTVKPNVAGVNRNPPANTKKFKITKEEKDRAERMGYSLERYAKEKAKLLASGSTE